MKKNENIILESIINSIPQYIFWKDKNLVFRGCNKMFANQFGFDEPKDIIGKTDYEFSWTPELLEKYLRDDNEVLESGKPKLDIEELQRQPDGSFKTVLVNKVPVFNKRNKVIALLGVYTDITEKKQLEQANKDKLILEKQVESLELMANTVAHELRTPLGTITMGLSLLINQINKLSNDINKKNMIDVIDDIKKQVAHTNTFINIILENAKDIESINLTPVSITPIINAAIDDYPYTDEENKKLIHVDIKQDYMILGDEHLLKHVILNLLKNSLFFIQKNQKGEIYITLNQEEENIILTFKDTAEGVSKKQMTNLFKNYYTKTGVGTGIGLGFCQRVINAFHGDIKCESKRGEFIEFIMTFPKI